MDKQDRSQAETWVRGPSLGQTSNQQMAICYKTVHCLLLAP